MTTSITYQGGYTITPDYTQVDSVSVETEPRTVSHEILDGPPVYTLRPAGPITGTLVLVFLNEQAATDAMRAHRIASTFTVSSTDRPLLNFEYVVTGGRIELTLEPGDVHYWTLMIPYQEVTR